MNKPPTAHSEQVCPCKEYRDPGPSQTHWFLNVGTDKNYLQLTGVEQPRARSLHFYLNPDKTETTVKVSEGGSGTDTLLLSFLSETVSLGVYTFWRCLGVGFILFCFVLIFIFCKDGELHYLIFFLTLTRSTFLHFFKDRVLLCRLQTSRSCPL